MVSRFMFVIFSLMVLIITASWAQKWGKVTEWEKQISEVPDDPEADAIILFHNGEYEITEDFKFKKKIHFRAKILIKAGIEKYSDFRISYWHEDRLTKLKAQTILPGGKKIKVKKKQIFEEKDRRFRTRVFAMPAVEVGAIVEYQVEILSEYLHFFEPWYFQHEEFTASSRLSVFIPDGFNYRVLNRNFRGLPTEPIVKPT